MNTEMSQVFGGLIAGAFFLFLAMFILGCMGVLKYTKALQAVFGGLFAVEGLGIILADIFSGYPLGFFPFTRLMTVLGFILFISGGFIVFSTLSEIGKQKKKVVQ